MDDTLDFLRHLAENAGRIALAEAARLDPGRIDFKNEKDLAYVAAGRLEGFWELNLKPYDVAAGALLVSEAGGRVTDRDGNDAWPEHGIIATNGLIHEELQSLCRAG